MLQPVVLVYLLNANELLSLEIEVVYQPIIPGTPLVLTMASTWYAARPHRAVSTWFKEKYGCTGIGDNLRKMTDEARGGGGAVIKAGTAAHKAMW